MLNRWYSFECFAKLFKFGISHFSSRTICESDVFIHDDDDDEKLSVYIWLFSTNYTILAVLLLMLSIFLVGAHTHTWNRCGIKMVAISTNFDICVLQPSCHTTTWMRYQHCWKGTVSTTSESFERSHTNGWLLHSLIEVEQPHKHVFQSNLKFSSRNMNEDALIDKSPVDTSTDVCGQTIANPV